MKKRHISLFVQQYLENNITKNDTVIDATIGNGHDTLKLAELAKFVYGFDIQKEAIINTKERLLKARLKNYKLILDSHENILNYIKDFKGIVFNLGYLPGSDKSITTTKDSTINTLEKLTNYLIKDMFIIITCYPSHDEGYIEATAVKRFSKALDDTFYILHYEVLNAPDKSPFVILIEKKD